MSGGGREAIRKMFMDEVGKAMNDGQRKKLEEIIDNKTFTKQQMRDNVKSYCEGIGGDCQTKFNEMVAKLEAKKNEFSAKIKEAEGTLSAETKALLAQAKEIHQDQSITHAQEHEKFQSLLSGASDSVKAELKAIGGPFANIGS